MVVQAIASSGTITRPSAEVVAALTAGSVRIRRRAEIYESDGVTPFEIERWDARLTGGSVTADRMRAERRMMDLGFENEDHALDLDPYNGFWYDKIVKTFWGIDYFADNGLPAAWEIPTGEFMIDRITNSRFPKQVKVTGRDYTKKLLGSKISTSMQFPRGTPAEDIIRAVAVNGGITKFALPTTGRVYSIDLVWQRGTDRWKIITDVADSVGYEVYFRADGYLTMRPYPDPTLDPIVWAFKRGVGGSLVDYEKSSNDSLIRNHVQVIGATKTVDEYSTTIFAEVRNTDPLSPTRIDRIGERTDTIENSLFEVQDDAENFAATRLRVSSLEEFEVNWEGMIIPWLEPSDIIDVDATEEAYVPARFLLSNFTLPVDLGAMTGVGRRITIAGSNQLLEYQ